MRSSQGSPSWRFDHEYLLERAGGVAVHDKTLGCQHLHEQRNDGRQNFLRQLQTKARHARKTKQPEVSQAVRRRQWM